MNVWVCGYHGCMAECHGVGGAIGLCAIGWAFRPGGTILCPRHRDSIPCLEHHAGHDCPMCAGEAEAMHWQDAIEHELGIPQLELLSESGRALEQARRDAWEQVNA